MNLLACAIRLTAVGLVVLLLLPLQLAALRFGRRFGGRLPMLAHRLLLWGLGLRVTVRGAPPEGGPTLVVANHVSWLDIPVIGSLRPLAFVAKSEIAGWPVIGALARLQRTVFIERMRKAATAEVNAAVARRLAGGEAIVLFPEGTTGDGNRMLPFRSSLVGAARAALADPRLPSIRLQPLALSYVRRSGLPITRRERPAIAWYGDMELGPHLWLVLREGPLDAVVTWGEPILVDGSTSRKEATTAAEAMVRQAVRTAA